MRHSTNISNIEFDFCISVLLSMISIVLIWITAICFYNKTFCIYLHSKGF